MSNEQQALTAANIRYLLVIRKLDTRQQGVRGTDIAKLLGVTKPSVFTMTQNLRQLGLVEKEKYGTVFLTPLGQKRAAQYADCYTLLVRRLESSFGRSVADYRNAACELLADTPEADLPLLRRRLQR